MPVANPIASFTFNIPAPTPDDIVSYRYDRVSFLQENLKSYGKNQPLGNIPFSNAAKPDGSRAFYFHRAENTFKSGIAEGRPPFVSKSLWSDAGLGEGYMRNTPSGFLSGNGTVMPKLIIPSTILADNGIFRIEKQKQVTDYPLSSPYPLSNWILLKDDGITEEDGGGTGPGSLEAKKVLKEKLGLGNDGLGSQYLTTRYKLDETGGSANDSVLYLQLNNPGNVPPPADAERPGAWKPQQLVGGGAFCLFLNIVPLQRGKSNPEDSEKQRWKIKLDIGAEVVMELSDTGTLQVSITANSGKTSNTKVQLTEASAAEAPPQFKNIKGGKAYAITVYPVWNGVVVSSGVQDTKNVRDTASTFCEKKSGANPFQNAYSTEFDPQNPAPVKINSTADVRVDFGSSIKAELRNCRADIAYMPCYFANNMIVDCIYMGPKDDIDGVEYSQEFYPIWTDNNEGDWELLLQNSNTVGDWIGEPITAELSSDIPLEVEGTGGNQEYRLCRFHLRTGSDDSAPFTRFGAELLGFFVRHKEKRPNTVNNPNGNFSLAWVGGSGAGDPDYTGSVWDYVQSINVSFSIDGGSGSITLDKYGPAGWDGRVTQSIGAITVDIAGGGHPLGAGRIFAGVGYGVGETDSADSNQWTVRLEGMQTKLGEIMVVLPPYFDGMKVSEVVQYLCRQGGVQWDYTTYWGAPDAATVMKLGSSTDPRAPKFNFSAGTTIPDMLTETMKNVLVQWVPQPDGKLYFYALDPLTGLPLALGPDYSGDHPYHKIISDDNQPDFDDLRNEIVAIALRKVETSSGVDPDDIPLLPFITTTNNPTTPTVPWSKSMVYAFQGYLSEQEQQDSLARLKASSSKYEIIGKTSIMGDARIWPYCAWGDYVVYSVSHNIDFVNKTWTTDLDFSKAGV